MKTKIFYVAIFIFVVCNSITAQNFDFRNTKWGMDSTQVKKSEMSKLVFAKKNTIVYNGKLGEFDSRIVYNLNSSNKLYRASYIITLMGTMGSKNPVYYVSNFLMLQDLLTQKYKAPYSKTNSTINGKEIKQEEWAANLISDNLTLETKWKTNRTDIILTLYSINDELCIEIIYSSLENGINDDQVNKAEILKVL